METKIKTVDIDCHTHKNSLRTDRSHNQNHSSKNNYKGINGLYLLSSSRKDTAISNISTSSIKLHTSSSSSSSCPTSNITGGGSAAKQILLNNNNSNSSSNNSVSNSNSSNISNNTHSIIPSDILDDLASRFIINVPDYERNNLIRICFQIELAHWFYLDFFCSIEDKKLMPCGIKQFAILLFQHIPFLRAHLSGIDKILENWKEYKLSVPTYGAILVSEDLKHVLLVQSYWAKSSWGFPKGKVNEHEDPIHCAAREVFEETGYDISNLIVPNDYIEAVINYQYTRLYLVSNVPLETVFSPRTRKEIKCIEWFPVDALPINKNDTTTKQNLGINANSFFMIMPFMKRLKKWVQDNRCGINSNNHNNNVLSSTTAMVANSTETGTPAIGKVQPFVTLSTDMNTSTVPVDVEQKSLKTSNNNDNNINTSLTITSQAVVGNKKKDSKISQNLVSNRSNINSNYNNTDNNNSALNNKNNRRMTNVDYNIPGGKRQRHKSMGDIDGIKINFNNGNNSNDKSLKYNGTKLNGVTNIQFKAAKTVGRTINGSSLSCPNNILLHNGNKREKYKANFRKRQILNKNLTFTNTNVNNIDNDNLNNSCLSKFNHQKANTKSNNNLKCQNLQSQSFNKQKNNFIELNKTDLKLSSNNIGNDKDKYSKKVNRKQKLNVTDNIETDVVRYDHLISSLTQNPNLKTLTINETDNSNILNTNQDANKKLGSNFDSWTSFTFTKNFISNVFC